MTPPAAARGRRACATTAVTCGVLLLAAGAGAQERGHDDPSTLVRLQKEESAKLTEEWLDSEDARIRAWGAYLTVRDRQVATIPRLLEIAVEYAAKRAQGGEVDKDEHASMLSVLDALIQLDGRMPRRDAATLYQEFPAPSIIFLSRGDEASDEHLLKIFREDTTATGAWLTAGNLLLARRPEGFGAALFNGLTVDMKVRVVDATSPPEPKTGTGGSCSTGAGGAPADWPPAATYYISQRGVLLSSGAVPTFYTRIVGMAEPSGRGPDFVCDFRPESREDMRQQLLAKLALEAPTSPLVRTRVNETLAWKTDLQYQQELRALIARQQKQLEALGAKLQSVGALTPQERAAATAAIAVSIVDARGGSRRVLPAIASAGNRVTIKPVEREAGLP